MIILARKVIIKWTAVALALTLVVGCSGNPVSNQQGQGTGAAANPSTASSDSNNQNNSQSTMPADQQNQEASTLLSNIMLLAKQGKVLNCDFPVKSTNLGDVENAWGKPDQIDYVAAAKGSYAAYKSHNLVFGFNKGDQIFEIRSFDSSQESITLNKVQEVLGTPTYSSTINGQEIIGYPAGTDYKVEMVFPMPSSQTPNPVLDHYNVLYPHGTINMMAGDPGRQW